MRGGKFVVGWGDTRGTVLTPDGPRQDIGFRKSEASLRVERSWTVGFCFLGPTALLPLLAI